jgi:hypothetical protein
MPRRLARCCKQLSESSRHECSRCHGNGAGAFGKRSVAYVTTGVLHDGTRTEPSGAEQSAHSTH